MTHDIATKNLLTMRNVTVKIIQILLGINALGILLILAFFNVRYLYAFEIGFISSTLVMLGSSMAYRRMVNTRVEHNIITMDDSKDMIDKFEDPYDLYSEDVVPITEEENDKHEVSRRSLYETLRDTRAALSFYRMAAYILLILGFLYLNRQGLLHIPSYIIALGLPPMVLVFAYMKSDTHFEPLKD
ncbi:MAG: hypothetical protein Q9M36_12865 [Sulfurovum sp.]|nr:hypothetical protein [Sulfurovum sp.]